MTAATLKYVAASALLAIALLVMAGWSYGYFAAHRRAAISAQLSLERCRKLTAELKELKTQRPVASVTELAASELTRKIEAAAQAAQLPPTSLLSISPEPARRLADTPYKEKPTRVDLRDVALSPAIRFLHSLSTDGAGLTVQTLRLTTPRTAAEPPQAADLWDAEVTISYLIYDPPPKTPAAK